MRETPAGKDIVDEVISGLSEDDIAYIRQYPDPVGYHFGLGLYIRNKYKVGDYESGKILACLIQRLLADK